MSKRYHRLFLTGMLAVSMSAMLLLSGCGDETEHASYMKGSSREAVENFADGKTEKTFQEPDKSEQPENNSEAGKSEQPENNSEAGKSQREKGDSRNTNRSSLDKPSLDNKNNSNGENKKFNAGEDHGSGKKPAKTEKPSESNQNPGNGGGQNGGNQTSDSSDKPVHKHSYIHVAEKSHTEYITETYTEQVPNMVWIGFYRCLKCGFEHENIHNMALHIRECKSNYTADKKQVQDGCKTVTKERKVPKKVIDDPAHDVCVHCGKRK